MSDLLATLPPKLAEIAEVIGVDAALKLSAGWPGIRLHIPQRATETHAITLAIGLRLAQVLCDIYGGSDVVVPMARSTHRQRLHLAILEELDRGATAPELARKYGMHQFTIYRLSGDRRRAEQRELF